MSLKLMSDLISSRWLKNLELTPGKRYGVKITLISTLSYRSSNINHLNKKVFVFLSYSPNRDQQADQHSGNNHSKK